MNSSFFIYTEIVNCGKIGKIALDSFHKYHNHPVHVYGTKDDFAELTPHPNNILIEIAPSILAGYTHGHIGTALLWEQVIKSCTLPYMIHFDSDVIFRANVLDDMMRLSKDYDLIGPIRNYHHNPQHIQDVRHLTDVCQTNCTLWNRERISPHLLSSKKSFTFPSIRTLISTPPIQVARQLKWFLKHLLRKGPYKMSTFARMIHGTYNPFPFRTIDFFDPVMFDMIRNGASIYHLNFDEVGGCNYYGSRNNAFSSFNNYPTPYKLDFGEKLVHFSCVGSGMNFYTHPERQKNVGTEYVKAALDRYALFCKVFYNETLPEIDLHQYGSITSIENWY